MKYLGIDWNQTNSFSFELLCKEICRSFKQLGFSCSFFWQSVSQESSILPVTSVQVFWCLIFLSPTCVLLLSSQDGNPAAKMRDAYIINPKQFSESEISQSTHAFRENQNSNAAILKLALGMGGTVSLTVTKISEDWQMNIWFFLAFIVSILYHSLVERVEDA